MIQIIPENRKPKFSDQLMTGLGRAASAASTEIPRFFGEKMLAKQLEKQQAEENSRISELLGQDISGISDREVKKEIVKSLLKRQETGASKIAPLQSAFQRVQRMKQLGQGGRLGRGSGILGIFGGERAKEAGEYERLGKSLIQYSTNIPIRNRSEFEALAHDLYDPTIPDSKREGILNAMEQILLDSLSEHGEAPMEGRRAMRSERPPLSSFGR